MLAKVPPAIPSPAPKVAGFAFNRDRSWRAFATAVTALTAFIVILILSCGYVLLALA